MSSKVRNAGEGCQNIAIGDRKQPFHLEATEYNLGTEQV